MIAVDTNILIRFLTQDDMTQYKKSLQLIKKHQIYIPTSVIQETEWVLRFAYNYNVNQIANALSALFGLENVHIDNPNKMAQVIQWHKKGFDFSDALHLSYCDNKIDSLYTFDKKFVKRAQKLNSCEVKTP